MVGRKLHGSKRGRLMLTWDSIQSNAVAFSKRWQGIVSEKQQDQGFVEGLLRVFGVDDARAVGTFQEKTRINNSPKWIDYFWKNNIAIEMKSKGESLDGREKRTLINAALKQFRYINGGLFRDVLPSAEFNEKMRQTLLDCVNFDWSKISPAALDRFHEKISRLKFLDPPAVAATS